MPKPNEFKKIRTVTITKTHVETIYKALKRHQNAAVTQLEKDFIQALMDRLEHQTRFKVEPDPIIVLKPEESIPDPNPKYKDNP